MTYLAQAKMTEDNFLLERVAACVATLGERDARLWAANHMWLLSAQPEWGARYAVALAKEEPVDPADWYGKAGADPEVITDQMILDAVGQMVSLSGTMDTA